MGERLYPGYSQDGGTSQRLLGVEFFKAADLGGDVTIPVGVGQTVTRGPFVVAGFNTFMLIVASVTNANVTFQYTHVDPETQVEAFTRTVATLAVSAVPLIATFGANAAVGGSDSFIMLSLKFVNTSGALSPTVSNPRLWASGR